MKNLFYCICSFLCIVNLNAQDFAASLDWDESPFSYQLGEEKEILVYHFAGAVYENDFPTLPIFSKNVLLNGNGALKVSLVNQKWEAFDKIGSPDDAYIGNDLSISTRVEIQRKRNIGVISFVPIRKNNSGYERLTSFTVKISQGTDVGFTENGPGPTYESVLLDGDIYKIQVSQKGIFKLDYNFLLNELGVQNLASIDPRKLQLFGNGGGMLPELIVSERIDDLKENAISIVGEEDGSFDEGDYILFYGEGPDKVIYDEANNKMVLQKNIYETDNHYFIKVGDVNGKRLESEASLQNTVGDVTSYDFHLHFQEDKVNLLDLNTSSTGSGKEWLGSSFEFTTVQDFPFSIPNLQGDVMVDAGFAARSVGHSSTFRLKAGGQEFSVGIVQSGTRIEEDFAKLASLSGSFTSNSNSGVDIEIEFSKIGTDQGWLNYINLNAQCALNMVGNQFAFRNFSSLNNPTTAYNLSGAVAGMSVWDITDPTEPVLREGSLNNGVYSFGASSEELKEYFAFTGVEFLSAIPLGKIANQNLHGILETDMVIIYHPNFLAAAEKLKNHRSAKDDLDIELVNVFDIYNEFSSGNQDPTAIRDFVKMIYDRTDDFRFVCLFGDGSFDFRGIVAGENNTNYIPVYESVNSVNAVKSYASDDYYGLLSAEDGNVGEGKLDVAVGRIPVSDLATANLVVDKIIHYESSPESFGDWKNRLVFLADDEDGNRHLTDADAIAEIVRNNNPDFNVEKIYFDAFQQIATPAGNRFPTVTEAINRSMFKGQLVMNYMGHGGSTGWAQERVLRIEDIEKWDNYDRLPLFVTATCSFAPYDNYKKVTAGEYLLLKPNGGSVALFSTTRAVYAYANRQLTEEVFETIFENNNGVYSTIGEVLIASKNNSGAGVENSRKFSLLGDPSMKLAIPEYKVNTTKINGVDPMVLSDTISAMEMVTIEGEVVNLQGEILNGFSGEIFPTVFDKVVKITTLGNDEGSNIVKFNLQKNVIFKGKASVVNGKFTFSFVVPKDINYQIGAGKISYYGDDQFEKEVGGYFEGIFIGGSSTDAIVDEQGPEIEVFMNDEKFVFGGITDENPTLYVKLKDDNGINTTGNSIGHDLTAELDETTTSTFVLNDFYETDLDDFRSGTVKFPLSDIPEGIHSVRVKAWDVANNSSEGYTEFLVAASAEIALSHVLNYPNPFVNNTTFQFEHNHPNQNLDVQVQVFTVGGRLVKTIQEVVQTDGFRICSVAWDGTDDFGDRIGRGVYLYKVIVSTESSDAARKTVKSEFEKLVILR